MLLPQIYPVTCHTDHVGPGTTFVAIKGFKLDGEQFITLAQKKGAIKIITDKDVSNTRKALAELSIQALENPASKLKIIGITGTSGKTTTTYLIDYILQQAGYKTALLGTIKAKILDKEEEGDRTTPESDYIQMFLAQCVKMGVEYVTMEVSSHSLDLFRVHGITFDAIGFTNLSPEHLDYHKTMENYFQSKAQIFKKLKPSGTIIINTDSEWGVKAYDFVQNTGICVPFGQQKPIEKTSLPHFASLQIDQNDFNGLALTINNTALACPKLFAEFNAYNISMAFLVCKKLGIPTDTITQALKTFTGVPGRLQVHNLKDGAKAFVDYAHKPDPFEKVLKTLRHYTNNLIVVFGCGGERDTTKRPLMGALAAHYGDKIIVTDDNPRGESREKIAQEILAGIPENQKYKIMCELDRRKAIEIAAHASTPTSIIALLGKGHETHYLINNQIFHLDDLEEIQKF